MARPRKQTYTMAQYLENVNEGYISNDADTQRNPAWKPIVDGIAVTILTEDFIPNIILGEEDNGQMHIVDGGSRTAAFKMLRYGNYKIKSSVEDSVIQYKRMSKDENGKTIWEDTEFDIRNKTFEQFPKELQKRFDEYQVETVIHEHCTKEKIAMYIKRYNEHKAMNANQKMFVYLSKFAEQVRDISNRQFFLNHCDIKDVEKDKGILERVISESVMLMFHFDKWNKNGKKLSVYLNDNATESEFNHLNENITRLENIVTNNTKILFNSRDTFIWFALFDKFTKLGVEDSKFGDFLNVFVNDLRNKPVDGKLFDRVDDSGSTKDRGNITTKLYILESLMKDFLHIEDKEVENITTEEFISKVVDVPVETVKEEIEVYKEDLGDLQDNAIKDGSKLLDVENQLSLLAMVAYAYKNDLILDDWLEDYASKNNTYYVDQSKNFKHMVKSLTDYNKRMAVG